MLAIRVRCRTSSNQLRTTRSSDGSGRAESARLTSPITRPSGSMSKLRGSSDKPSPVTLAGKRVDAERQSPAEVDAHRSRVALCRLRYARRRTVTSSSSWQAAIATSRLQPAPRSAPARIQVHAARRRASMSRNQRGPLFRRLATRATFFSKFVTTCSKRNRGLRPAGPPIAVARGAPTIPAPLRRARRWRACFMASGVRQSRVGLQPRGAGLRHPHREVDRPAWQDGTGGTHGRARHRRDGGR
jgi:hypothetical protein